MLVAEEAIARKRVGGRERNRNRKRCVDEHINKRIEITPVPGWVREYLRVIVEGKIPGPQGKLSKNLVGRLERHIQEPINRQHKEQDIDEGHQVAQPHYLSSFFIISV
jgi:hypothetical protein